MARWEFVSPSGANLSGPAGLNTQPNQLSDTANVFVYNTVSSGVSFNGTAVSFGTLNNVLTQGESFTLANLTGISGAGPAPLPFWDVLLVDPSNSANKLLLQGSASSGLGANVLTANGTLIGTGSLNNITAASGTWAQLSTQVDDGTALGNWTVAAVGVGEGGYGPTGPTYGQPMAQITSLTVGSSDVVAAVPEPSTWAMMVLGFAGLGLLSYRRTRKGGLNFRFA